MAVHLVVRRANATRGSERAEVGYEFEQPRLLIGRGSAADLRLPALTVSERHATLERTERGYQLHDEGSTNGTHVNGTPLVPGRGRSLHDGDELQVGEFLIGFQTGGLSQGLTSPERTTSLAKRLLLESTAEPPPEARLCWRVAGAPQPDIPVPAPPARWVLGSAPEASLHVVRPELAPLQLELEVDLDGLRVRDLERRGAMHVNGKPMRERRLRDGDRVEVGPVLLWLDDPAERALLALEGQGDASLPPTEPLAPEPPAESQAESQPAPAPDARDEAEPEDAAPSPSPAEPKPRSMGLDAVVYGLALTVLGASALGLAWLLSGP